MKNEIWKDIPGYEGLYQVSNLGRVKSLITGKKLKELNAATGYLQAVLYKNRIPKRFLIHRLVAETFIKNPNKKPTVNHKNGVKHDNRLKNLEWATYKENMCHAFATGLNAGHDNKNNKKSIPVAQYDKDMNLIKVYPSMNEAGRNGFRTEEICKCCKGKSKTTGGYIWKYA